jgi:hypothetical protein
MLIIIGFACLISYGGWWVYEQLIHPPPPVYSSAPAQR